LRKEALRFRAIVGRILSRSLSFQTSEVASEAKITRQAAHRHLSILVREGMLVREGLGRGAVYRRAPSAPVAFRFKLAGLREEEAWEEILGSAGPLKELPANARSLLDYAATELINNSIDHSGGRTLEVRVEGEGGRIALDVSDDGIGAFEHVRKHFDLPDLLSAVQELSKGKITTAREKHTGEGLFFVSKIADVFELESNGLRWTVDNALDDHAIRAVAGREGTQARFELRRDKAQTVKEVFDRYTRDFEFTKTRIVVRLFEYGTRFVSRSEAKRLVNGLERFREAVLDFKGVVEIGQGFADEVFRVWAAAHPGTKLIPESMVPAVEFFVRHALANRE
jgi:anti-sigma regulatory factor (Ser/Thr protein kinase)